MHTEEHLLVVTKAGQKLIGVVFHQNLDCNSYAGFHLGISSWRRSSQSRGRKPQRGEGRLHNYNYWQYRGGKLGQFGGEVELFGGSAPLLR